MASALYRIGWIYNDSEDYAAALEPLKRAVSLQPDNTAAYFELGYANKKLSRLDQALPAFQQSVRIKPDYAAHITRSVGFTMSRNATPMPSIV